MLSATIGVVDGTLIVRGTRRADQIVISQIARFLPGDDTQRGFLDVTLNGRTRSVSSLGIRRVRVEAGAGDDRVQMSDDPFEVLPPGTARVAGVIVQESRPATILGGDGDDTLIGGWGDDSISGGGGRDAIAGSLGDDTLDGGSGSDVLIGQDGNDVMLGGRGDDRFTLQGNDTVEGGLGGDLYTKVSPRGRAKVKDVEGALSGAVLPDVRFEGNTLVVFGTRRADRFGAYNYFLSPGATITVNSDSTLNLLGGGVSQIRFDGGDGDDQIIIGSEEDFPGQTPEISPIGYPLELVGGAGNDTLIGSVAGDTLIGGQGDDVLAGGPGNDSLDGGEGSDTLRGNSGGDHLTGGVGDDSLDGGAGSDFLSGGAGTDVIFGGPDSDSFEDVDNAAERKDMTADELIVIHPPLPV
ncbi:MAG TPA: calcium-binding protein [Tepidisphaeraceae bacterium]